MSELSVYSLGPKTFVLSFANEQITHWHIRKQWLLRQLLLENLGDQIEDIVMTSNALTLFFKLPPKCIKKIGQEIKACTDSFPKNKAPLAYKKWVIPVCFDNDYRTDLSTYFANDYKKVTSYIDAFLKEELIVHHFGFLPGFCYLSGLKKELQLPRKQNPILKVPKGSVAVGGTYAGIYPQQSPGGWHLIGRTNVAMFRPEKDLPTFANPGDSFMFEAISKATYLRVFNAAAVDSKHPKYTTSYAQP